MSEPAALVPVPFFAPVRTGTGSLFEFSENPRPRLIVERQERTLASEPDAGLVYSRGGRYLADMRIGRLVNIYA